MAIEVQGLSATTIEVKLRQADPPIVARIQDERVVIDLRTVSPDEDETIAAALRALRSSP